MPKENDLEGPQDQGGKHGGQAGMPKSKRPPDLETERGKRRQELPGDQDQRAEQRADSLRPVQEHRLTLSVSSPGLHFRECAPWRTMRTKWRFARNVAQDANGIPGFRPASIAPLTRWTVPFTASETSAMVDFGSGTASKPSWAKGAGGMSSLTI